MGEASLAGRGTTRVMEADGIPTAYLMRSVPGQPVLQGPVEPLLAHSRREPSRVMSVLSVLRADEAMLSKLRRMPNQLTLIRLLSVPAMWICAILGSERGIGLGLIVAGLTDLIDGPLARRLNQTSQFGARFDSLADQFVQLSAIAWVYILMPEIFSENRLLSLAAIGVYLTSLSVGVLKFRRIANLHLYLSKVAGLVLYVFVIHAFLVERYSPTLFLLAISAFIISSAETLLLQTLVARVDENIGSVLFLRLSQDHPLRRLARLLP
ncbi:MAG: CDP-alcohol phosphatidyltransferase family protein [Gemmatimonadota bacterium]